MIKLLVPVDFSKTSINALRYAINLFEGKKLETTVLHVYGAQSTALMMKSIDGVLLDEAKRSMDSLIKELQNERPLVNFKSKFAKNYAVSTISELGNSGQFDFIVMGTKGVSGLKEVFMGSVAGGVVSKTSAPVFVVPLDYSFKDLNEVVFAVGENVVSENTLKPLKSILELHNGTLEILHISNDETKNFEVTMAALQSMNPKLTHKSGNGDLNQQINVHIQNHETDLLALVRTKKDFFDRLFEGSVTLKQTFNSSVPILILHD